VGPGNEVSLVNIVVLPVSLPLPGQLIYEGATFVRDFDGTAAVTVEGPSSSRRGNATFARYAATNGDGRIWIEDFQEARTSAGHVVDPEEIKVYRK
jgi:hypothetical protein